VEPMLILLVGCFSELMSPQSYEGLSGAGVMAKK